MILSDKDLQILLKGKLLTISPFNLSNIRESSIKLHLNPKIIKYQEDYVIDLNSKGLIPTLDIEIKEEGYKMLPGEFLLGMTDEEITMPNGYMGWIETRGSIARAGIQAHLCDAHIDPGSHGHITLQLKNNSENSVIIYPHLYIVKLYLIRMTSKSENPYAGKYQGQTRPTTYQK